MAWTQRAFLASPSQFPRIGLSTKPFRGTPDNPVTLDQNIELLRSIGAKVLRMDVNWDQIETSTDKASPTYNTALIPDLKTRIKAGGLVALLIVNAGHRLYTGDWSVRPKTAEAQIAYAKACRAVLGINTVGSSDILIEIQNEPDLNGMTAAEYGTLLARTLAEIRAVNSAIPLISGGLSVGQGDAGAKAFLAGMLDQALVPAVDVSKLSYVGFHPYTGGDQFNPVGNPNARPENVLARMGAIRPASPAAGSGAIVINTEQGVPVCHCSGTTDAEKRERQAVHVTRQLVNALLGQRIAVLYNAVDDGRSTSADDPEQSYGMFDFDFALKPAGRAFKQFADLMAASGSIRVEEDTAAGVLRTTFNLADGRVKRLDHLADASTQPLPVSLTEALGPVLSHAL